MKERRKDWVPIAWLLPQAPDKGFDSTLRVMSEGADRKSIMTHIECPPQGSEWPLSYEKPNNKLRGKVMEMLTGFFFCKVSVTLSWISFSISFHIELTLAEGINRWGTENLESICCFHSWSVLDHSLKHKSIKAKLHTHGQYTIHSTCESMSWNIF